MIKLQRMLRQRSYFKPSLLSQCSARQFLALLQVTSYSSRRLGLKGEECKCKHSMLGQELPYLPASLTVMQAVMFGSNHCSQAPLISFPSYFCSRVERALQLHWVTMLLTAWIMLDCHKTNKWYILAIKTKLTLNFSVLLQGTRNVLPGQKPYMFVQKYPDKQ